MTPATSGSITVRRWRSVHLVPRGHPVPERARDRFDEALRTAFSHAAAETLAARVTEPAELIFIRSLHLELAMNAAWDRDRIGAAWLDRFARELLMELSAGDSDNVIRFPTRARWLATYLVERAAGGRGAWFHGALDGWSVLSRSAAIRSALCDEPGIGLDAVRHLAPRIRAEVVRVLEAPDAAVILRSLAVAGPPVREEIIALAAAAAEDLETLRTLPTAALSVWLLGTSVQAATGSLALVARLITCIAEGRGQSSAPGAASLLGALTHNETTLKQCVVASAHSSAEPLLAIVTTAARSLAPVTHPLVVQRYTRSGGAFLLLGDLVESDCETRLLVLGYCLADDPWLLVEDDCWRDLCGLEPEWDRTTLGLDETRTGHLHAAAGDVLSRFARRLPGFSTSSTRHIRENFLSCAATLDFEAERIVVSLTRPPLDLILNLAGLNRGIRHWSWLDDRPFLVCSGA